MLAQISFTLGALDIRKLLPHHLSQHCQAAHLVQLRILHVDAIQSFCQDTGDQQFTLLTPTLHHDDS